MSRIGFRCCHVLFVAALPVLILFGHNVGIVRPADIVRPLLICLSLAITTWAIAAACMRNLEKGAIFASVSYTAFFFYGAALSLLGNIWFRVGPFWIGKNTIMFPLLSVVLILVTRLIVRGGQRMGSISRGITFIAGFLVSINGLHILWNVNTACHVQGSGGRAFLNDVFPEMSVSTSVQKRAAYPDIYYIVLDGYARSDVLQASFQFDNAPFIHALEKRGFRVLYESVANYSHTALSLSSSLNMTYLDHVVRGYEGSADRKILGSLIRNSVARRILEVFNYKFVVISSGYTLTEIPDADIYITQAGSLSEFESILLQNTAITALSRLVQMWDPPARHRRRVQFAFRQLSDIAKRVNARKFVFVHIVSPHPDFVFKADGTPTSLNRPAVFLDGSHFLEAGGTMDDYLGLYPGQVQYVNDRIIEVVDSILAGSASPPIIILQSDHGPGLYIDWSRVEGNRFKERFGILNALYFPPAEEPVGIHPGLSPVNTFRVLFNTYFCLALPLLPDRSYYSTWNEPYVFTDVTDEVRRK